MPNRFTEVQSLHRALDILEFIGNTSSPAQLKTITNATNLPKSTVYRLLRNLEARGYVACDSLGFYRLGLKLLMMSQQFDQDLKHIVRPFLIQLNNITGETVFLGVLEKNKALYVDMVESPHSVRLVAKPGSTNSLHCTSLGKALLFGHSDDHIREILASQGMETRTRNTISSPEQFIREMNIARTKGYALDDRESAEDCRCVGAPVYNHKRQVVAAVSISGPEGRFALKTVEEFTAGHLLAVTGQISAILSKM